MSLALLFPLGWAVLFVLVAGVLACLEAALSRVSRVRVEELVRDDRPGALRLQAVLSDPPRSLNLLLLLRLACELAATAIVVTYVLRRTAGTWPVVGAVAGMTVVSYVFIGVAPRTIGRQQAEGVALRGVGPGPRPHEGLRPGAAPAHPARQRADARQGLPRGAVRLRGRAARPRRAGAGARRRRALRARHDQQRLRAGRHDRARGHGAAHRHPHASSAARRCGRR